ncbi:OpgC domain-containing protein [Rhizobium sp. S163]|uniref:OpgC family protein n=1 Tax=Rhizobium sp. S163 TaxID=3055039 RepID=UPI0025AA2EF4|nr:OpgC domain-containing protein [Rhizobium sp. S163]
MGASETAINQRDKLTMQHPAAPTAGRDPRLDFFRGLALVMIFINHVPGNMMEGVTSKNFGFSDAAEAFVLMSGMSAGLAYSNIYVRDRIHAIARILRRASRLYSVHLLTTVLAVIVLMAGHNLLGTTALSQRVNMVSYLDAPWSTALGVLATTHQLGYFNILPLYMLLLAATPVFLALALRSRALLLTVSVTIWAIAGWNNINLPNYPTDGSWFLNPFSWQLIYCIGLCAGISMKKGESLVGYSPVLMATAIAYLGFAMFVIQGQHYELTAWGDHPALLIGFEKGILPLPRLIHILALSYVISQINVCRVVAGSAKLAAVSLLGKQGLAVFAWGSLVCISLQVLREAYQFSPAVDISTLIFGLAIQYVVAQRLQSDKVTLRNTAVST